MESCAAAAAAVSSVVMSFPFGRINKRRNKLTWPCYYYMYPSSNNYSSSIATTRVHCHKMYVPGFGEASPEAKAANNLHNFFTYVAVRIVLAQLQSYNPEAYQELMQFLDNHSLNDGDKFCAQLMRESPRHRTLALRILEVRSAYCRKDFEWDNLKKVAFKRVDESNTRLMRDYVVETSTHVEETDK